MDKLGPPAIELLPVISSGAMNLPTDMKFPWIGVKPRYFRHGINAEIASGPASYRRTNLAWAVTAHPSPGQPSGFGSHACIYKRRFHKIRSSEGVDKGLKV
ncbi:hypothetical protein BVG16_09500 [Paenibacillus selenitireducens]|uniref:Uncharacterized protein n=1 Tax=Paenibacillus selenitireducens TaxID=1324314 RepID=A0A1T2XHN6_9BACL|nr:hypothetical protein BVG16_09500 [Paenibacillus selenitireducens]